MGLLNLFSKTDAAVRKLPSGSMTVDRDGNVVTSTVSSTYPAHLLQAVAAEVLKLLREARTAHLPLATLTLQFGCLQITARELRGGAIIFFSGKTVASAPLAT